MTHPATLRGMVDSLVEDSEGVTELQLAFARSYLGEGPMDPAIVAALQDPDGIAERERQKADRLARDWAGLGHYRRANAAIAGQPVEVVFMGDSITEMWGVAQPDLFSKGLVNRGVSGQTSPQMLLRFMPDVIALKPRTVHLMCGVNDVAGNTGPTTPQDYKHNVSAMLDLAQAHEVGVILASLTPLGGFTWAPDITNATARVAELNDWLAATAAERGLVQADYHAVLSTPEGAMRPELTRDGVHPNGRGYDVMRPVLDEALARSA